MSHGRWTATETYRERGRSRLCLFLSLCEERIAIFLSERESLSHRESLPYRERVSLSHREFLRLSEVRARLSLSPATHEKESASCVAGEQETTLSLRESFSLSERERARETARETCPLCL